MTLVDVASDDHYDKCDGAEVLKHEEGTVPHIDEPCDFTLQLLLEQQLYPILKDELGQELDCDKTS